MMKFICISVTISPPKVLNYSLSVVPYTIDKSVGLFEKP